MQEMRKVAEQGEALTAGVHQMHEAMIDLKQGFDSLPKLIRPFVHRDFKQNMGLTVEEWTQFLERLQARLTNIHQAAEKEDTDKLREHAQPLLDRVDLVEKKLHQFRDYTRDSEKKMKMAPPGLLTEDMKRKSAEFPRQAEQVGEAAEAVRALAEALAKAL